MRHCRSSPCDIAAPHHAALPLAALPLMSYAVIYMRHCRLCGWMDEANGVPTIRYQYRCGVAAHVICCHLHCRLCGWMDEANGAPTLRLHTEAPRHRGTETPRHRETETPRHRDTETLRNRDTETQRHREWWGRLLLFLPLLPLNGINVHAQPTWR